MNNKELQDKVNELTLLVEQSFFSGYYAGMNREQGSQAWNESDIKTQLDRITNQFNR